MPFLIFNGKEDKLNLQEGQVVNLNFEFVNISRLDFQDSLVVEWEFNNTTTKKVEKFSRKIPAVKSGEKYGFNIEFNSTGNGGISKWRFLQIQG
jgi:DUF971 family protein